MNRVGKLSFLLNVPDWAIFIGFLGLVVLLRWSALYQSVLDWDESLYLLVADRWLQGHSPYTVIWDNKPPGIYLLFAGALSLFGHSVVAIRILACLFVTATCYCLYLLGKTIGSNGQAIGLVAGGFYAVISTSSGGLSSNTEVFFIPCSVLAFYLVISATLAHETEAKQDFAMLLAGLSLGIGFEIKQVVLFDLVALLMGLWLLKVSQRQRLLPFVKSAVLLLLGFILPFLLVTLCFWVSGNFQDYIYANFTANYLRASSAPFSVNTPLKTLDRALHASYLGAAIYLFCFPALLFLAKARRIKAQESRIILIFGLWFCAILLGTSLLLRNLYYHYFLQLNPPLVLLAAYVVVQLAVLSRAWTVSLRWRTLIPVLIVILVTLGQATAALYHGGEQIFFTNIRGIGFWKDTPALVANYLQARISLDSSIYIVDDQPIIYFLTKANIPTRYILPSFLIPYPGLPNITGINPIAELDRLMAKKPLYIIKQRDERYADVGQNQRFYRRLNRQLSQLYELEKTIETVNIYRLSAS